MAFKASKIRVRKAAPIGEGKPIVPNAGIALEYEERFAPLLKKMFAEYEKAFSKIGDTSQAEDYFESEAMDASLFDLIKSRNKRLDKIFDGVLNALNKKWEKIFNLAAVEFFSGEVAGDEKNWCEKAGDAARRASIFSMQAAGIKEPREVYFKNNSVSANAIQNYNTTLITGLQQESHKKISDAVFRSLSSENPEEQGMPAIMEAVKKEKDVSENRLKLIARDQTSKLYGALGTDNMKANAVMFFRWQHTFGGSKKGRGKIAWRESHEALSGEVFHIDDPELWKVGKYFKKKGDIGTPGYAIHCHCRMIPIVLMTDSDWGNLEARYSAARIKRWKEGDTSF